MSTCAVGNYKAIGKPNIAWHYDWAKCFKRGKLKMQKPTAVHKYWRDVQNIPHDIRHYYY